MFVGGFYYSQIIVLIYSLLLILFIFASSK